MTGDVLGWSEAVADSKAHGATRSVLLGNGYSMAWDAELFGYSSLYDEAELVGLSIEKKALFEVLGTFDFEKVVEATTKAALLAELYSVEDPTFAARLRADAEIVRNGLADVLTARHPDSAREVPDEDYRRTRKFLAHFANIFSVNYDLLPYWAANFANDPATPVVKTDGFQWPTFDDASTLVWKQHLAQQSQRLFFLHGAFHLFEVAHGEGRRVEKLFYEPARPLIQQVRERMDGGSYPLVVTEGTSADKRARIERSDYLRFCRESLRALDGVLFTYGWGMAPNDQHIFDLITDEHSRISALYVSVRPESADVEYVKERSRELVQQRGANGGKPLILRFYDADSAHVWH